MQFLTGVTAGVAWWVLGTGLVVASIFILVAGRKEQDEKGRRIVGRYAAVIMLLSTVIAVTALWATVDQFIQLIPEENSSSQLSSSLLNEFSNGDTDFGSEFSFGDEFSDTEERDRWERQLAQALQFALLGAAAIAVYMFHDRVRNRMAGETNYGTSPAWRSDRVYIYAICFFAALIVLVASASSVYGLIRTVLPAITTDGAQDDERRAGLAQLLSMLTLTGLAGVTFWWHWGRSTDTRPVPPAKPVVPPAIPGESVGTPA